MGATDTTKISMSLKKLVGKAHTKNENELYNESLPSGVTMGSNTVFGEVIPLSPDDTVGDVTSDIVELVRFDVDFILGTDSNDGKHAFKLKLPTDYASSNNPKVGTGDFTVGRELVATSGGLQLVPPSFADIYEAKVYYGASPNGTLISAGDARDWVIDYYNGVIFQQDPPDDSQNPTYVEAYLYIGDYLDTVVSNSSGVLTLGELTNVSVPSPGDGEVLTWSVSNDQLEAYEANS